MDNQREQTLRHLKSQTDKLAEQPLFNELFNSITFNQCMSIAKYLVVPKILFNELWFSNFLSKLSQPLNFENLFVNLR